MQSGTIRVSVGLWTGAALLLTLGVCTPRTEVAVPEKPITINLTVKIDHELRLKVDKDLDQVLSNDSRLLDEAKAKGLVEEKSTGYLGAVNPSNGEAQALVDDANQKRRRAYEDIAERNRISVQAVETLAGDKAVHNTKPGNFIESPAGWIKK